MSTKQWPRWASGTGMVRRMMITGGSTTYFRCFGGGRRRDARGLGSSGDDNVEGRGRSSFACDTASVIRGKSMMSKWTTYLSTAARGRIARLDCVLEDGAGSATLSLLKVRHSDTTTSRALTTKKMT